MKTKSFLMGYFYAGFIAQKRISNCFPNSTEFNLKSGHILKVDINRGICPLSGNVGFAYLEPNKSLFCIPRVWCPNDIWNEYITKWFRINEDDEVRIELDELIQLIDFYGGLG